MRREDERLTRVLIEAGNALTRLDLTESLTAHGFEVTACAGTGTGCPLLEGRPCAHVAEADVVVNALAAQQTEVYVSQRTQHPERPVLLLTDCLRETELSLLLDDIATAPSTAGGAALAARVAELVQETRP